MNNSTIIARLHVLEKENARLKSLLEEHGILYEVEKQDDIAIASKPHECKLSQNQLSLQEKVELFQSLFKGREQ